MIHTAGWSPYSRHQSRTGPVVTATLPAPAGARRQQPDTDEHLGCWACNATHHHQRLHSMPGQAAPSPMKGQGGTARSLPVWPRQPRLHTGQAPQCHNPPASADGRNGPVGAACTTVPDATIAPCCRSLRASTGRSRCALPGSCRLKLSRSRSWRLALLLLPSVAKAGTHPGAAQQQSRVSGTVKHPMP